MAPAGNYAPAGACDRRQWTSAASSISIPLSRPAALGGGGCHRLCPGYASCSSDLRGAECEDGDTRFKDATTIPPDHARSLPRPVQSVILLRLLALLPTIFVLTILSGTAEATTQRRISPFWTSIEDCLTTVHLRNNLIDEELTVHPIFFLEDGVRVPTDPVTLAPRGNASIQVNKLMASLGYAGRFGGAEFVYERDHGGALNVETEVLMPANSLAYSVESFAPTARGTNEKHGVFWLPMRSAEIFFAVYNSSDETIKVRPELTFDGARSELDVIVLSPRGFGKVRMPGPHPWPEGREPVGSITIRHEGPAGAVQATGWIDCDGAGYSAMMAFTDPGLTSGNELYGTQTFVGRHRSLRALGRAGDVESHLVLKNMSSVALAAEAEIFYTQRGGVGVSPVRLGTLQPGAVASLSFDELQSSGLLPRSVSEVSILVRHRGQEGALMGRIFGVSSDRTFGFYTKLESYVGGGYDAVHWTTAGDRDSVITVANFGEEADDVTVTLAYNGGSLDLPKFTLESHAAETINVRDYLRSLPRGVVEGGYAVHGKDRRKSKLLTKQHVISASEEVALPFYGTPVYAIALYMNSTASITLLIAGTDTVWLWLQWSDSTQDPCAWCDDSSANPSIATIGGGGYGRTITGVDVGNTTVQANSWEVIDEFGTQDYIMSLPQKAVEVVSPQSL